MQNHMDSIYVSVLTLSACHFCEYMRAIYLLHSLRECHMFDFACLHVKTHHTIVRMLTSVQFMYRKIALIQVTRQFNPYIYDLVTFEILRQSMEQCLH